MASTDGPCMANRHEPSPSPCSRAPRFATLIAHSAVSVLTYQLVCARSPNLLLRKGFASTPALVRPERFTSSTCSRQRPLDVAQPCSFCGSRCGASYLQ